MYILYVNGHANAIAIPNISYNCQQYLSKKTKTIDYKHTQTDRMRERESETTYSHPMKDADFRQKISSNIMTTTPKHTNKLF